MAEPRTVEDLLKVGERVLADSSHIDEGHDNKAEAEQLLALCLNVTVEQLGDRVRASRVPPARARERYLSLVARRAAGEPLPHLTGRIRFYGLDLPVRPGSFVPRPSSELTVARAARVLRRRKDPVVVDACTGAGPIALALADEFPEAQVWGTDIDRTALAQGRRSARDLGLANVTLKEGDMYGALPRRLQGAVDVITAHVPYVPPHELDELPTEIKEHEPVVALWDQSDDGLGLMRQAVREAPEWLKPNGWLLLEMSEDLAGMVRKLCVQAGLEDKGVATDRDGLSVVVEARKPAGTAAPAR